MSTATDVASFASITGWRIGILSTKVWNSMRSVATPIAAIAVIGSRNGLFSRNSRVPSGLYGYFDDDCCG